MSERRNDVPSPEQPQVGVRNEETNDGAEARRPGEGSETERSGVERPPRPTAPEQAATCGMLGFRTSWRREADGKESDYSRYRSPQRPIGSWGFASAVVMPGAQSGHQPKRALQGRAAVCRVCGVSGAQTREDTNECATDTPHTRSRQQASVRCALGHNVGASMRSGR